MKVEPWQEQLMEALETVSDVAAQRAAWIGRTGSWLEAPGELICQVFDDSGIDELLPRGPVFSEATDAALERLGLLADEVDVDLGPEDLLSSKAWLEFTREAARVLALVRGDLEG